MSDISAYEVLGFSIAPLRIAEVFDLKTITFKLYCLDHWTGGDDWLFQLTIEKRKTHDLFAILNPLLPPGV